MGKIRGTHSSPGVYTRPWFDGRKIDTRKNRKSTLKIENRKSGSKPKGDVWLFGDPICVVFS
jgi:hypothetical protein